MCGWKPETVYRGHLTGNHSLMSESNHEMEHTAVSEAIRRTLLSVQEGGVPQPVQAGAAVSIAYRGTELPRVRASLVLEHDRLTVRLHDGGVLKHPQRFGLDGWFEGELAGGVTFRAASFRRITWGRDFVAEADDWTITDGAPPSLWMGEVEGAHDINFGGNLIIERVPLDGLRMGHARHFRLAGAYTYYLVQRGRKETLKWYFIIDTEGGFPDKEKLESDFLVLQFALGRQLRIPALVGFHEAARATASLPGAGYRECLLKRSVPPIPLQRNNDRWVDESWAALLFERVSRKWRDRPELATAFWVAIDSYLSAITNHVDADYLRLHVALESLAYTILQLGQSSEPMVVSDKEAWKAWVKAHSAEIEALASPGFEASLVGKVMSVYRLASGRVVPGAFELCGLEVTAEMHQELRRRNMVVHQGIMTNDYDGDSERRRVALVRTMLVGLLARVSEYSGAINGWDLGVLGLPTEPGSWWRVADDNRRLAHRRFVAEEFEVEEVYVSGTMKLLSRHSHPQERPIS